MLCVQKGAAMNQYIGQQFADLRYEKNILVIEETTSGGRWGFFNAAFLCPASACLYDSAAWDFFVISSYLGLCGFILAQEVELQWR